jgi:hypothetical protein
MSDDALPGPSDPIPGIAATKSQPVTPEFYPNCRDIDGVSKSAYEAARKAIAAADGDGEPAPEPHGTGTLPPATTVLAHERPCPDVGTGAAGI